MALRFEELIKRHHDEIFAYLWRLMGKERRDGAVDTEDLLQEVFLRAYRSFAWLRQDSNPRAWLYKIATHCAYSKLRQVKDCRRKLLSLPNSAEEPGASSEALISLKSMAARVRLLIDSLPVKQKACVTLRYLQDLDYPEIAQILGCSQASARSNVYQAIRRLRRLMEKKR